VIAELQLANPYIQKVHFECAPWLEIHKILELMGSNPATENARYPLFAVIMPYTIQKGLQIGVDGEATLRIIIAKNNNETDRTPARYHVNFEPILYPIMLEFFEQLDNDKRFETVQGLVPHTQTDWPYYDDGKETNPFPDFVDVIELSNLKLKILTSNC